MIPNPWVLLGALAGAVALAVGAFFYGQHVANVEWTAKIEKERADATAKARQVEQSMQESVDAIVNHLSAERDHVAGERDRALRELRNRPERASGVSEAPRPDCQGATGAELSRADAEFLVGEAARADAQRAALAACYEAFDGIATAKGGDPSGL